MCALEVFTIILLFLQSKIKLKLRRPPLGFLITPSFFSSIKNFHFVFFQRKCDQMVYIPIIEMGNID